MIVLIQYIIDTTVQNGLTEIVPFSY